MHAYEGTIIYILLCVCVSVQVVSVVIKSQKFWSPQTVGCGLSSAVAATGLERDSQQSMKVCVCIRAVIISDFHYRVILSKIVCDNFFYSDIHRKKCFCVFFF